MRPPRRSSAGRGALLAALAVAGLAGLLFVALRSGDDVEAASDEIPDSVLAAVFAREGELLGRPLTDAERAALQAELWREEVLVRAAYERGLHRWDPVIRVRLAERMRLLLEADQELREPTRDELARFLAEREVEYRVPPTRDLEHVFFATDSPAAPGDGDAAVLWELEAGADPAALGERFWLGPRLAQQSEEQLAVGLGPAFAARVFAVAPGGWHGPIESTRGTHFVRVTSERPAQMPTLEQLLPVLRVDWSLAQREARLAAEVEGLATELGIERPSSPADAD